MVKEVPQPSKYQCEHCDKVFTKLGNAQKCEAKGLPEFKYNVGDGVETIIQLTRMSETKFRGFPIRLFDEGGEFARVKIADRYYFNHTPVYTFEHPQIQGQYWRYPEMAFELPEELTHLKEIRSNETFEIGNDDLGIFQFNERNSFFRIKWRSFRSYLNEHGIANLYSPKIIAEPINPS